MQPGVQHADCAIDANRACRLRSEQVVMAAGGRRQPAAAEAASQQPRPPPPGRRSRVRYWPCGPQGQSTWPCGPQGQIARATATVAVRPAGLMGPQKEEYSRQGAARIRGSNATARRRSGLQVVRRLDRETAGRGARTDQQVVPRGYRPGGAIRLTAVRFPR